MSQFDDFETSLLCNEENREERVPDEFPCSEEFELLISKFCDGECSQEELEILSAHLQACPSCRDTLEEYREISMLIRTRLAALPCPPPPDVRNVGETRWSILQGGRVRTAIKVFAGIAACALFFVGGHLLGFYRAQLRIAESVSPISIATPSMWAASHPSKPAAFLASVESEQPFTHSIERYRAAIGQELRRDEVNWMRVRDLVEAMGELRTDLELLTIHLAYLDIHTGTSPYEVADHWDALGRVGKESDERAVHKP